MIFLFMNSSQLWADELSAVNEQKALNKSLKRAFAEHVFPQNF